jgi:hypothetical protein
MLKSCSVFLKGNLNMNHIVNGLLRTAKSLVSGASSFYIFEEGANAEQLFKKLVSESRRRDGDSYSGGIGMKDSFKIVSKPLDSQSAEKLARNLVDSNDKYDPAFAIPVLSSKEEKTISVRVRVKASEARDVRELALSEVRKKWSSKGFTVDWADKSEVSLIKPSNYKMKMTKKGNPKLAPSFSINFSGNGVFYKPNGFKTYKEAVEEAKRFLFERSKNGVSLPLNVDIEMSSIPNLAASFSVDGKDGATYEVTGKVRINKSGDKVSGYLFFGFASE